MLQRNIFDLQSLFVSLPDFTLWLKYELRVDEIKQKMTTSDRSALNGKYQGGKRPCIEHQASTPSTREKERIRRLIFGISDNNKAGHANNDGTMLHIYLAVLILMLKTLS